MNNIIFSVIVPYKGRLGFVKDAINSVLNQSGVKKENVEILAIGDPSGEKETREKLKKLFPRVKYLKNEDKEGPGGNRQTGFDLARGKYVVFLDSDDRLLPNFLKDMRLILEEDQNNVAALCFSDSVYEKGFSYKERIKLIPMNLTRDLSLYAGLFFNRKKLYADSFYSCQFSHMLFKRKEIISQKFNYDYRHGGEDWDFFIQTLRNGEIRILPEKLVTFRYSPGSSTSDPINRIKKWDSYRLLVSRLSGKFKTGIFYNLLLIYIGLFGNKNAKK